MLKSSFIWASNSADAASVAGNELLRGIGVDGGAVFDVIRGPSQVFHRRGDARQGVLGALKALVGEIERRAMKVRLQHKQAQRRRRMLVEH